ncbi:hypothetical protein NKI12_28665 [Mesorhizobium australicum]|uniref:Uncharacterized protein n=1 Tax=Mesorhizobium australicum TaxID=536018 RepID=A0ACC6T796_9HYPH
MAELDGKNVVRKSQLALCSLAIVASTVTAASARDLWVPVVHLLAVDGSYHRFPLKGTEKGVGFTECDLRKEAWLDHYRDSIEIAKNELAKQGQQGGITITCEPLDSL